MTSIRHFMTIVEGAGRELRRDPFSWVDAVVQGVPYDHGPLPTKVYHGTTAARWNKAKRGTSELHVAVDSGVASEFAKQWVKYDGAKDPIVVEFELSDLLRLRGVTCGADHDFLELVDRIAEQRRLELPEPTWRDSIEFYSGKFTIEGFKNAHKALGTVMRLP